MKQSSIEIELGRFSSQIAVKMVSLAMEEDEKTVRQGCMDVINHPDFKATVINHPDFKRLNCRREGRH